MITFSRLGDVAYFGRLGNQLFQISSIIGISRKNKMMFSFPQWEWRSWFYNHLPLMPNLSYKVIKEPDPFHYHEFNLSQGNYDLQGYFQSEKYFSEAKDDLRYYLTPNFEINDEAKDRVAIHVRRGDYLERSNFHTNLTMDYYKKATSIFPSDTQYSIFSDDIDWCKQHFLWDNFYFIEETYGPLIDMFMMSTHKAFIIANSSFSWWGAYLHELFFGECSVIAPKNWFVNNTNPDLIPERWLQI